MTPEEMRRDDVCARMRAEASAWLDGQCEDAAGVEAHLAGCAECARYARELGAASRAMKNLPAPTVGEGFSLAVAARLRRAKALRAYWPVASGLLAAAAILIIVGAVFLSLRQPSEPGVATVGVGAPTGEYGLVGEILEGADAAPWDYGFPVPAETIESSTDDLVVALADSGWFEQAAEAWEADADIEELVMSLDEAERVEFRELLRIYQEGAEI